MAEKYCSVQRRIKEKYDFAMCCVAHSHNLTTHTSVKIVNCFSEPVACF